jgi:tRNA(Arg) A34 adenosine deaminase TadA
MTPDETYMRLAIRLAQKSVDENLGGPFGCVIVKDGEIVGEGFNQVTTTNDPTAHAEVVAIRNACQNLESFQLDGCSVYTSCEPCPMCSERSTGLVPSEIFMAATRDDAAAAGFDDEMFYSEFFKPNEAATSQVEKYPPLGIPKVFKSWVAKVDKIEY